MNLSGMLCLNSLADHHSTMRYCFYTNIISPHQIPWCKEVAALVGAENFRYVYTEAFHKERAAMGWNDAADGVPCLNAATSEAQDWAENADVLVYDGRDIELFERRAVGGLKTYCASERWFKPLTIPLFAFAMGFRFSLPGWVRLCVPSFWRMARRFRKLLLSGDVVYLPTGIIAAADMVKLVTLRPCSPFALQEANGRNWQPLSSIKGYPWMKLWGYFVAPSKAKEQRLSGISSPVKVLWVGRLLKLKNVDTIIRAFRHLDSGHFALTIVGDGPEKVRLMKLAEGMSNVIFLPSVRIETVRQLMREHDIYVFPSNGFDGWGAVVSEALEEGMLVFGSCEAGASATLLPSTCQFKGRDWRRLTELMKQPIQKVEASCWSARNAARAFVSLCEGIGCK